MESQKDIFRALTNVVGKAHEMQGDISKLRLIVFSDHHRGRGDGADDFVICQDAYMQALQYYQEQGHTLVLLGDVEEFWENTPRQVMATYEEVLCKEAEFFHADRFARVWGNHDDMWSFNDAVEKHFHDKFPGLKVYEAITLALKDGEKSMGNILMVHGHQGTLLSEKLGGFSRLMVRYVWRNIQRLFRIASTTPSTSVTLRSSLDEIMFNWANSFNNQIVICGHTHDAIFMSSEEIYRLNKEIRGLKMLLRDKTITAKRRKQIGEQIESLRNRIRHFKEMEPNIGGGDDQKSVYFNTGCCSYSDGSITGIEICEGSIQLIEWSGKNQKEPFVIADRDLRSIFRKGHSGK